MIEKKKDAKPSKPDEELDRVLRATTPSDFDGHTDFGSLTISQRKWRSRSARCIASANTSIRNGFAKKSTAPPRTASTARSIEPKAVISNTI